MPLLQDPLDNPLCNGNGPHSLSPEVRRLPLGSTGIAILCKTCFLREINWRHNCNQQLDDDAKHTILRWQDAQPL